MSDMNLEQARFNMVEQQVRTWEVLDPRILEVMQIVHRELFVPDHLRNLAYSDMNLPLGYGEMTLSPRQQGRFMQALELEPDEQVLEVGTGSGYMTACMGHLAGRVYSIDIHGEFLEAAAGRLEREAVRNVTFTEGDAASGWDDGKRHDAIVLTGSLPEFHEGFHQSLTIGGRLLMVVGDGPMMEALLITRVAEDQWATESIFDTWVPPLRNAPRSRRFDF